MIGYSMKDKYNLSQHSDIAFTPNQKGGLNLLEIVLNINL